MSASKPEPRITFDSRIHAGKLLGNTLKNHLNVEEKIVVLGLPRGGVTIADQVWKQLIKAGINSELDVLAACKIGFPENEEFAIGAASASGKVILNEPIVSRYKETYILESYIQDSKLEKQKKAQKLETQLRNGREPINLEGKTVILVDDGIATGMTMKVAIEEAAARNANKIIVAVPVLAHSTLENLHGTKYVDDIIFLDAPHNLRAIGFFYRDFSQVTEQECIEMLNAAWKHIKEK